MKTKEQIEAELELVESFDHELNRGSHDHEPDVDCVLCAVRRVLGWVQCQIDPETGLPFTTAYPPIRELRFLKHTR